eukprot:maker-scaffold408_size180710-snap-gene-0.34 protein:Tk05200 transcript:maker-scaffold408_size180710-snap-gene-0.34-mRNA-1 annotation:"-dependent receptor"
MKLAASLSIVTVICAVGLANGELGEIEVAPLGHRFVPTGPKTYKTEKAPTAQQQATPYLINFSQISNLLEGVAPLLIPNLQKVGQSPINTMSAKDAKPATVPGPSGTPILKASNDHLVTVDMCYYFGNDLENSHIRCDERWNPSAPNRMSDLYKTQVDYLNEITYVANQYLNRVDRDWSVPNNNFRLTWRGAWNRSDYFLNSVNTRNEKASIQTDIRTNQRFGCDINIFMHFNTYRDCFSSSSNGQEHSGIASGAACESHLGEGYAKVVDQGYLDGYWVGPQVLAHHILLLLSTDLYVKGYRDTYLKPEELRQLPPLPSLPQNCPNPSSLLHSEIYSGQQWRGDCIGERLQLSRIPIRSCLHD